MTGHTTAREHAAGLVTVLHDKPLRDILDALDDVTPLIDLRRRQLLDTPVDADLFRDPTQARQLIAKIERLRLSLRSLYNAQQSSGNGTVELLISCAALDVAHWLARAAAGRDVTGFPARLPDVVNFLDDLTALPVVVRSSCQPSRSLRTKPARSEPACGQTK